MPPEQIEISVIRFWSGVLNLVNSGICKLLFYVHLTLWGISCSAFDQRLPNSYLTKSLKVQVFPLSSALCGLHSKAGDQSGVCPALCGRFDVVSEMSPAVSAADRGYFSTI